MARSVGEYEYDARLPERRNPAEAAHGDSLSHLHPRIPVPTPTVAPDIESYVTYIAQVVGYAPRSRAYIVGKRVVDVILASIALIVLSPLLLLVALAIRLDSAGPALFIQDRVGHRGRIFRVYKFRTMKNGSGVELKNGSSHKQRYDARITRVGRVLRKTSFDEIPQLINVVLGQMSIVGPRPEIVDVVLTKYQPWQYQRLLAPQGMTGWWQVTGRGNKLLHEHTEDDLYYIRHASFWFDLRIMALTIPAVLRRDGAF
jgi:lipopolysaccharide/colanic/teichoic acid biosynthesis glycosyltransferase